MICQLNLISKMSLDFEGLCLLIDIQITGSHMLASLCNLTDLVSVCVRVFCAFVLVLLTAEFK